MAKVIDITEKLSFEGNPSLKIGDVELEINGDAETVLKILAEVSDGTVDAQKTMRMIDLLLPEESREKLAALKLSMADYNVMLTEAMQLATGAGEDEPGEEVTRTTT